MGKVQNVSPAILFDDNEGGKVVSLDTHIRIQSLKL